MALSPNLVNEAEKYGSVTKQEPWKNVYGTDPMDDYRPKPGAVPPGSTPGAAPNPLVRGPQYNNQFSQATSDAQSSVSPNRPDDYWSVENQYKRMTADKPVTSTQDFQRLRDLLPERTDLFTRDQQVRQARMDAPDRINGHYNDAGRAAAENAVRARFAGEDTLWSQGVQGAYNAAQALQQGREGLRSTEQLAAEHERAALAQQGLQAQGYAYGTDATHAYNMGQLGLESRNSAAEMQYKKYLADTERAKSLSAPLPEVPNFGDYSPASLAAAPGAAQAAPGAAQAASQQLPWDARKTQQQNLLEQKRVLQQQALQAQASGNGNNLSAAKSLSDRANALDSQRQEVLNKAVDQMGVVNPQHKQFVLDYLKAHPEIDLSSDEQMGKVKALTWMQSNRDNIPQPSIGTGLTRVDADSMPYLAPDAEQPRFMNKLYGTLGTVFTGGMANLPNFLKEKVKFYDRNTGDALYSDAADTPQGILNLAQEADIQHDPNATWLDRIRGQDRYIKNKSYFPGQN